MHIFSIHDALHNSSDIFCCWTFFAFFTFFGQKVNNYVNNFGLSLDWQYCIINSNGETFQISQSQNRGEKSSFLRHSRMPVGLLYYTSYFLRLNSTKSINYLIILYYTKINYSNSKTIFEETLTPTLARAIISKEHKRITIINSMLFLFYFEKIRLF